jgi:Lar family restriction alleviation protein
MNDAQNKSLLPCPFCGEIPSERRWMDESVYSHATVEYLQITCDGCDAGTRASEKHDEIRSAWNTRAALAASPEPVARQIEVVPELNMSNYDEVDVARLNEWAIRADAEIDRLAEQIEALDKLAEKWLDVRADLQKLICAEPTSGAFEEVELLAVKLATPSVGVAPLTEGEVLSLAHQANVLLPGGPNWRPAVDALVRLAALLRAPAAAPAPTVFHGFEVVPLEGGGSKIVPTSIAIPAAAPAVPLPGAVQFPGVSPAAVGLPAAAPAGEQEQRDAE